MPGVKLIRPVVRPQCRIDGPACVKLLRLSFPDLEFNNVIGEPYVLFARNIPLSTCQVKITDDTAELMWVATHPLYRREGYAEYLMREVLKKYNTFLFSISLNPPTTAALELYKKLGFK